MSKRFSTLDTTRLLFEHPKILFRMIERMDRNEARYIRESDLVAEVMDIFKRADGTKLAILDGSASTHGDENGGLAGNLDLLFQGQVAHGVGLDCHVGL